RESAMVIHPGRRGSGKTTRVHFVNNRVFHRPIQGLVAFPVVSCVINDDGTHGTREIVVRSASIGASPKGVGISFGIWVDENFLVVETMTGVQIRRAIHAISIVGARL